MNNYILLWILCSLSTLLLILRYDTKGGFYPSVYNKTYWTVAILSSIFWPIILIQVFRL